MLDVVELNKFFLRTINFKKRLKDEGLTEELAIEFLEINRKNRELERKIKEERKRLGLE